MKESGSAPKSNRFFLQPCATPPENFIKIRSQIFGISCRQTDIQTDSQMHKKDHYITSSAKVKTGPSKHFSPIYYDLHKLERFDCPLAQPRDGHNRCPKFQPISFTRHS